MRAEEAAPVTGATGDDRAAQIGRALPRREDARFLAGRGCFIDDFVRPGMAHAVVVRSAVSHAIVRGVDLRAARALAGVVDAFSAADIGAQVAPIPVRLAPLPGFERCLQPPLARERVRYVGEPVAVIVAEDRYIAEDAAELVTVDYEAIEPVVDVHTALSGASTLFSGEAGNLATAYSVARGDAATAFATASYRRTERFRCHRHSALPLETRGLVAEAFPAGAADGVRLRLWGATKCVFFNRRVLAPMLGLSENAVELVELDVGGSFGVRGEFYPEDFLVPFAAMRLGRPVKWIEDRRESFLATNHSREMECELAIAADRDGAILGMQAKLLADLGAYVRTSGGVMVSKAALFLPGPYRIPNYSCEVSAVVTNKTPVGTYRGPGRYESTFFRERMLDIVAADLGVDAAEIRRRNLIGPGEMPWNAGRLVPYESASVYDTGNYPEAFERALAEIGHAGLSQRKRDRADGRLHGIGLAAFVESSGAGPAESARIEVAGTGQIHLYLGAASSGQGHETVWSQILADAIGIDPELITVFHGTSSYVDQGAGTFHGRGVVMAGSAVRAAGEQLVSQLVGLAAAAHRGAAHGATDVAATAPPGGIAGAADGAGAPRFFHRRGVVYREAVGGDEPVLTLAEAAARARAGDTAAQVALRATGVFATDRRTFTYGTQAAHVAVDPETARVEVIALVSVEDVGRAVNPLLVHGQAVGAAVQGLGGALLEELRYDGFGQLLTGTFADYLMPTTMDFPAITAVTLENAPTPLNPLGAKGAGEGGIVAAGAVVANAIADALRQRGIVIRELPLSSDRLADLLRAARRASGAAAGSAP